MQSPEDTSHVLFAEKNIYLIFRFILIMGAYTKESMSAVADETKMKAYCELCSELYLQDNGVVAFEAKVKELLGSCPWGLCVLPVLVQVLIEKVFRGLDKNESMKKLASLFMGM